MNQIHNHTGKSAAGAASWNIKRTPRTRSRASVLLLLILATATPSLRAATTGTATYYSDHHQGNLMANGRRYWHTGFTCATNDYPLGAQLHLRHGDREVYVIVTDRMPPQRSKHIDLSQAAFQKLSSLAPGRIPVQITRVK